MKTLQTDVLVCGGGCAGIAAALAAARGGAKTLLVERAGFSGGIITCVGLPYFDGLAERKAGRFVVKGIAREFLARTGVCMPDAKTLDDCDPAFVTKYWMSVRLPNTEEFKLFADEAVRGQPNLSVLYHSTACAAEVTGGRVAAVTVANKDGLVRVEAGQVIDCTGDADIAAFAGCPTEKTLPMMPTTMHFRVGNVAPTKDTQAAAKRVLTAEYEAGRLPMFYGPGLIYAFAKDEVYVHAIRVPGDATDAADLSRMEAQGRADAWIMFRAWKKMVPGFENSYLISTGPYIGIRETRRIVGGYVLTADDIMAGKRFDDAVATGCWYMDRHPNKQSFHPNDEAAGEKGLEKVSPPPYDIPYRSLVARGASNLLVAGRCHSATRDASSSSRVTVTAMALGDAAGTAAALATKGRSDAAALSGVKVRDALAARNGGPFTDA